jgi:PAS domain S-box-containing protein
MRSIRLKVVLYTVLVLAVASGLFSWVELSLTRDRALTGVNDNARTLVTILAARLADDMAIPDLRSVRQQLLSARNHPDVLNIIALDPDGRVLSDATIDNMWEHTTLVDGFAETLPSAARWVTRIDDERVRIGGPVALANGRVVGYIYAILSLDSYRARVLWDVGSNLVIALGIIAVAATLAAAFSFDLGRRLSRIAGAAERIGAGDLTARVAEGHRDEVGSLAQTIDDMAAKLQSTLEARRRAEADLAATASTLETVISASPLALIVLDAQGMVRIWNEAAANLFGWTADEVRGRPYPLLSPENLQAQLDMTRQKKTISGEVARYRRDGTRLQLHLASRHLTDAEGRPSGVVVLFTDLSERNRLQEQLTQAQKMEAVGQLTGGVAHDINNLLGIIVGHLDLLQRAVSGDSEAVENLDAAIDAAVRGGSLVQSLLAFARRQPLSLQSIEIDRTIERIVPLLRRTLGARIEIATEIDENLWPIYADPALIESCIVNLALNARDAMPEGGRLTIGIKRAEAAEVHALRHDLRPGDYARIAVSDTGHGMTPEVLAKCFEPFFTTKEFGKGSGLGLSTVYGTIGQCGGAVTVASRVGAGTTVRLYLPRSQGAALGSEDQASKGYMPRGTERVMVVDDNVDSRALTLTFLASLGYKATAVASGDEAMARLRSGPQVDLLFTDIVLPGSMTGYELAERALRSGLTRGALFASAYDPAAAMGARPTHPDRPVVIKPHSMAELARSVRRALDDAARPSVRTANLA